MGSSAEGQRRLASFGLICALAGAVGFAFKSVLIKAAYRHGVDPTTLLALRMLYSLPLFLLMGLVAQRGQPLRPTPALAGEFLLLGFLGYYAASYLDFLGLQYISAGLERLILFTYPTLTVLIGVLFMGKSLERRQVGALVLSYAGIGLAFAHDLQIAGDIRTVLIGAGFVFGSALTYALYSAGAEPAIRRLGSARFAALAMLVSTAATQIHFFIAQPLSALVQPLPVYAYGAAMALFSTVLPVLWQSAAIRRIGSARAVLIGTLGPVLTIFFGWWLLAEPISLAQIAGAGLVLAGVLLVSRKGRA